MAKLLEFPSKSDPYVGPSVLGALMEEDTWMSLTPDLPNLRYKGPQEVFLWDTAQSMSFFTDLGLERDADVKIQYFNAVTTMHYLPFRNLGAQERGYPYYCMRHVNWADNLKKQDIAGLRNLAAPISGRVASVSAKAMCALDTHFGNGFTHNRQMVPIRFGNYENAPVRNCWFYFSNFRAITKYDPHEKVYNLANGVKISTVPNRMIGNGVKYEVTAFQP